jgi:hypothetical protein
MAGILEHWNVGKDGKKEEGMFLNFSNPIFHLSTLPLFQRS